VSLLAALPAAAWPPVATDAHGDPLPDGAVARLGITRFRVGYSTYLVTLSADGKTLIAAWENGEVRFLDAASGRCCDRSGSRSRATPAHRPPARARRPRDRLPPPL
jgi:hypothetical protein